MDIIKNVFNAGELSPKVWGRTDIEKRAAGTKTMLNTIPLPQGGTTRRPAFEFIKTAKNNNTAIKLIPFVFSTTQAYIMEFGPSYIRFFMNGGQVQEVDANTLLLLHFNGDDNDTDIIDEGATVHTVTVNNNAKLKTNQKKFGPSSCYFDGEDDYLSISDHADFNLAGDEFTIDFWIRRNGGTGTENIFSQHNSGGEHYELTYNSSSNVLQFGYHNGTVYTIVLYTLTTVLEDDTWYHIAVIRGWGGGANTWALTVNGVAVATLSDSDSIADCDGDFQIGDRAGNSFKGWIDEFRLSDVARWTADFIPPSAQYPGGDDTGNVYEVATSYNESDLHDLQFTGSYDTLYLTHKNHAPAQLVRSGHNNWALNNITFAANSQPAEWSNNNGWPRTCAFYQDRLVFASTTTLPSRLWLSKTENYTDLTTGSNDADGMVLNLLSGTSDTIFWLSSAKTILCGTDTGIQSIAASTGSNTALTPTNRRNYKESYFGTAEISPVKLGDLIIHAGNPASKIRELMYSWESDGFRSSDLTVLADHLVAGYTIKEFAYQQTPNETVWARRSDGALIALTFMQEQNVVGWSHHTSGEIESIACIPGETEDELWIAVHRNINSNTCTHIERLRPFAETSFNSSFFLDSGLSYNGSEIAEVNNLDHLDGNNVTYLADGNIETATVANNSISLNNNASQVTVGIPYNSDLELLPPEVETNSGPISFEEKKGHRNRDYMSKLGRRNLWP